MFVNKLPEKYKPISYNEDRAGYYHIYDPDTLQLVGPRGGYCSDYITDWFSGRYPVQGESSDLHKEIQKKKVFLFSIKVDSFSNSEEDQQFFRNLKRIETENDIKPTTIYLGTERLLFECDPIYMKYSHLTSFILKFYRDYSKYLFKFDDLLNKLPNSFLFKNKYLLEVCKNDTTYTGWVTTSLETHSNCGIFALKAEKIDPKLIINEKYEAIRKYQYELKKGTYTNYWQDLIKQLRLELINIENCKQDTTKFGLNTRFFTYLTLIEKHKKKQTKENVTV